MPCAVATELQKVAAHRVAQPCGLVEPRMRLYGHFLMEGLENSDLLEVQE